MNGMLRADLETLETTNATFGVINMDVPVSREMHLAEDATRAGVNTLKAAAAVVALDNETVGGVMNFHNEHAPS